jgi:hypothetical protein
MRVEGKPGQTLADVYGSIDVRGSDRTARRAVGMLPAGSTPAGMDTHLGHDTSKLAIAVGEGDAREASP